MKNLMFLAVLSLLPLAPVAGQNTEEAGAHETTGAEADAAHAATTAAEELKERLLRAIRLPRTSQESREEGVSVERVREVLRTSRERGIPAGDVEEILEVENEAIRAGGSADNFGAAVLSIKEAGLRGRELAAAIHAEQIARGMKKPKSEGEAKGKAKKGGAR